MLATLGWWDKGSRKAASEEPTVPHNCICGLSNTSKWQMGQGATSGKKTPDRTNQGPNFVGDSFSSRDFVRAPI